VLYVDLSLCDRFRQLAHQLRGDRARGGPWDRWSNQGAVWRRSEPEVVRSGGAAGAAGVPTETSATHQHTEAWERQEATPWHTLHRRQGGPEGGGASARADIRGGFSQLLLRVSAGAVVSRCAGATWTHDSAEESELCRRGGHQGIFGCIVILHPI
jgi:hypothetical protein